MTRIITVTSGKAGVGKTSVVINLAVQLAQRGQRVCLLDADGGAASAAQLLELKPRYTLTDLVMSGVALDKVLIRNCLGFDLVPGGSDAGWLNALSDSQLHVMATVLSQLDGYDFILIDSSFSIERNVRAFTLASPETVLVITPQPSALSDAYGPLRLLHDEHYTGHIQLVVNRSDNQEVGRHAYDKFQEVAEFYLGVDVPLLGLIGDDGRIQQAMRDHNALLSANPGSVAAHDAGQLADRLLPEKDSVPALDVPGFWHRFLRANGLSAAGEHQTASAEAVSNIPDSDILQRQLDTLSSRVGDLIAEVESLRAAGNRSSGVISFPQTDREAPPSHCSSEICFAVQSSSEDVTVQDERFSIYHMQRSNGDTQRFACHSLDDDIQEPEPQTTSS